MIVESTNKDAFTKNPSSARLRKILFHNSSSYTHFFVNSILSIKKQQTNNNYRIWQQNFWQKVRSGGVYTGGWLGPSVEVRSRTRIIGFLFFCFYSLSHTKSQLHQQLPEVERRWYWHQTRIQVSKMLHNIVQEYYSTELVSMNPIPSSLMNRLSTHEG